MGENLVAEKVGQAERKLLEFIFDGIYFEIYLDRNNGSEKKSQKKSSSCKRPQIKAERGESSEFHFTIFLLWAGE